MRDGRTELDDLDRPAALPRGRLAFARDARLFARDRTLLHRLQDKVRIVLLAPDQLLHPEVPSDLVVRRGKLRVSEFLPDGREVTRAILQAGAVLRALAPEEGEGGAPAAGADGTLLGDSVLMALGEVEVWRLPEGMLPELLAG